MNQKTTSKKPDALQKLRQIIREEVKNAIKDEMVPILLEIIKGTSKPLSESKPVANPSLKNWLPHNSVQNTAPVMNSSNVMSNILEETRQQMLATGGMPSDDEYRTMISANTGNMSGMFTEQAPPSLEDSSAQINSMLASAGKSMREEMVEINHVPDFTALVKKMNL